MPVSLWVGALGNWCGGMMTLITLRMNRCRSVPVPRQALFSDATYCLHIRRIR